EVAEYSFPVWAELRSGKRTWNGTVPRLVYKHRRIKSGVVRRAGCFCRGVKITSNRSDTNRRSSKIEVATRSLLVFDGRPDSLGTEERNSCLNTSSRLQRNRSRRVNRRDSVHNSVDLDWCSTRPTAVCRKRRTSHFRDRGATCVNGSGDQQVNDFF